MNQEEFRKKRNAEIDVLEARVRAKIRTIRDSHLAGRWEIFFASSMVDIAVSGIRDRNAGFAREMLVIATAGEPFSDLALAATEAGDEALHNMFEVIDRELDVVIKEARVA